MKRFQKYLWLLLTVLSLQHCGWGTEVTNPLSPGPSQGSTTGSSPGTGGEDGGMADSPYDGPGGAGSAGNGPNEDCRYRQHDERYDVQDPRYEDSNCDE